MNPNKSMAILITTLLISMLPTAGYATRGLPDFVQPTGCGDNNTDAVKVLIAVGTHYGRTFKIAESIAGVLCGNGYQVDIRIAQDIIADDLISYDAVIAGSSIYIEAWHPDVLSFLAENRHDLSQRDVALYCVNGLLGLNFEGKEEIVDEYYLQPIEDEFADLNPLSVTAFAGAVDYRILLPKDWFMLRLMFMPKGDWTDWAAVAGWAETLSQLFE